MFRFVKSFCFFSLVFVALAVGSLLMWPTSGIANNGSVVRVATAGPQDAPLKSMSPASSAESKAAEPKQGAGDAAQKYGLNSAGDVIDLTRLVLENTRDQTTNLTSFIERATTVIVVFFTLLGAVGAAFGWNKLHDMEKAASDALAKFQKDLDQLNLTASQLQTNFQARLDSATALVHGEINDQIELIAARAEIDQAINGKFESEMANRMLANACKRIEAVLANQQVSIKARIRGMAHVAYAKKRLGDVEAAFAAVEQAANLAKDAEPTMFSLLAYNAACYACILQKPDCLRWLADAVAANPQHKEGAMKDPDFAGLKDTQEFQALVA